MLTIVDQPLRQCPTLANLEHTTRMISKFLGISRNLQLSEACKVGRVDLLDWIWSVCPTNPDDRTPGWSLTNYLRSDPHYHRWQFSKSLYVAAKRGDLEVMKWLFQHFAACEAPSDVVCAAAEGGHLHILRYLWDHRSRPEESDFHSGTAVGQDDDVASHENVRCTVKFDERCHAGNWGKTAIQKALENGQLSECLTLGLILGKKDRQIVKTHAVQIGQTEFPEKLLHVRIIVLHYASECSRPEINRKGAGKWTFAVARGLCILDIASSSTKG